MYEFVKPIRPPIDLFVKTATVCNMRLGEKIIAVARDKHLELKDVALAAGIPYNTLAGYTRAGSKRVPNVKTGLAMARVLGVSAEWLFDDGAELPPPPYVPPPPAELFQRFSLFPKKPDWEEVLEALTLFSLDRRCRRIARFIAQLTGQNRMEEVGVLERYLQALRDQREAEFAGNRQEVLRLMKFRQELEEQCPSIYHHVH